MRVMVRVRRGASVVGAGGGRGRGRGIALEQRAVEQQAGTAMDGRWWAVGVVKRQTSSSSEDAADLRVGVGDVLEADRGSQRAILTVVCAGGYNKRAGGREEGHCQARIFLGQGGALLY